MKLVDLEWEIAALDHGSLSDRADQLSINLPSVSLTAVGGFPFQLRDDTFQWCGTSVNELSLKLNILKSVGTSALLTYVNKSEKTIEELGSLCLEKNHLWAYNWIMISITFARQPPQVEMAFARDSRFFMSWIVELTSIGKVFTATGSIKDWLRYVSHYDDKSFDVATRKAMIEAFELIKELLP